MIEQYILISSSTLDPWQPQLILRYVHVHLAIEYIDLKANHHTSTMLTVCMISGHHG